MAELRATPYANPLTGLSNDLIQGLLGYMKDKQRTQQMQGLASLLESTGIPKTVERAAYADSPTGLLNALTNVNRANVPLLKPETADALMTLAPVPSGANKAAMAAGRAGERYAEKVVPQIMERGGLPAGLLEGMAQGSISPMDVWHGSPHGPFKKFDPSKARTGEGNASYGEGAYLAEARGTGESYRRQLAKESQVSSLNEKLKMVDIGGKPLTDFNVDVSPELLEAAKTGKKEFIDLAKTKLKRWEKLTSDKTYPFPDYAKEKISAYKELLDVAKKGDVNYTGSGFLYKVDLPDEAIPKMLDWDKPLSQQTPEVRQALKNLGYQVDKEKVSEFDDALLNALVNDGTTDLPKQPLDLSGESIYTKLKQSFANNERLNAERDALIGKYQKEGMSWSQAVRAMSPEDRSNFVDIANKIESQKNAGLLASEELQKQGITGIRYLDQASRGVTPKWVVNIPEFGGYDFSSLNEAKEFIKNNPQYKTELIEPQINTSNFVVFPQYQDLLRIKEINDKPITSLLE